MERAGLQLSVATIVIQIVDQLRLKKDKIGHQILLEKLLKL